MKDQRKTKAQLIEELAALRQSEERYRQIFESANDAIISLTLDGIITTTNRGAEVLLGWPREEQVGRHYREFLTPSSVILTQERARRIQAGEKVSSIYEIELLRKDGSVVPVEARSRFIRDREGKPIGILAIHRDITARKRAEATIIEWKNRYEAAIQASRQVFYDWDPHTNKAIQGGCVEQLYGCSAEEVPSDLAGMIELIHPDDREAFRQEIDRVITTETPFHLEYRMRRKDGSYITIEDQGCFFRDSMGNPVRMVGFLVDITERKRAEEALQESERRYRNLFENANDAIISVSLDGIIMAVNRGLEVATGWLRKELVGQHYDKLATSRTSALERERTRRALAGEKLPSVFEAEMRRKDGSVVPVEGKARFIRNREGKPIGYQTIFRDITERKRAEETLRESEERYRSVIVALEEGIILQNADGTIQACNAGAERILGVPAETMKGQTSFDWQKYMIHEGGSPFPAEEVPAMITLRTGKPCSNVGMGIYKPNGELRWISVNSQPLFRDEEITPYAVVTSFTDITTRKQAEAALQESEERQRLIINAALDAVITIDAAGLIAGWNLRAETIFGWSQQEAVGQPLVTILIPFRYREAHGRGLKHFLASGEGTLVNKRIEISALHKDGREFPVELIVCPIRSGETWIFSAFVHDITDRKQAEEEKQKLQEQLFQARKMEALGTLAGGVAHDFNNILSAIMGFTELTTDEVPEGTAARRNLEEVLKASRRAKVLVQQILAFSRPSQPKNEPIQPHPIIEEVLTFLRASLPKTIELRHHIARTAGPVAISSSQLQQVLTNLCVNAIRALEEKGGVLEIRLQRVEVEDDFARTQKNLRPGPHLRLTVSDTGCGMTSVVQERIFEPFFTTRPVGEGNGLGLAIVHGIVTGHGGGIAVESALGKGTTFHVYLPMSENDVAPENILPHSPSPVIRGDSGDKKGALSDTTHFGY
jgi:PAS domain S-box-containing protein